MRQAAKEQASAFLMGTKGKPKHRLRDVCAVPQDDTLLFRDVSAERQKPSALLICAYVVIQLVG